jgi:hypothetical protein
MKGMIMQNLSNASRHKNTIAEMIVGLIQGRDVSTTSCALFFEGNASKESKIRKAERFYHDNYLKEATALSTLIAYSKSDRHILIIDRTTWERGSQSINAFVAYGVDSYNEDTQGMLGVMFLDNKGGNSNIKNRKELLDPIITSLGNDSIMCLLADREFFSFATARYLIDKTIPFAIRLKENLCFVQPYLAKSSNKGVTFKNVIVKIKGKQSLKVDLSIKRLKDEYLIVASHKVKNPLKMYRKRWNIECFFKKLKTAGYNLEATRLSTIERLKSLFLLCGMAYLICTIMGIYRHNKVKKMKYKQTLKCFQFSFFRYGLDWLIELSTKPRKLLKHLKYALGGLHVG